MSFLAKISSVTGTATFKKVCATLLVVLLMIFPGSKASYFSGLPLSTLEIFYSLILIIFIWGTNWLSKWKFFVCTVLFLVLIHIVSVDYLPVGWDVCLRRQVAIEGLKTRCEHTPQFRDGSNSYVLKEISFVGKKFPLYFMNSLDFNFYQDDQHSRNNLPYSFEAFGYAYTQGKAADLTVTSSLTDTALEINGKKTTVDAGNTNVYKLTDAKNRIIIKYKALRSDSDVFKISSSTPIYAREISNGREMANIFYRLLNYVGLIFLPLIFLPSVVAGFVALPGKNKRLVIVTAVLLPLVSFFAQKIAIAILPLAQYALVFLPPTYSVYLDRIKEILPATLNFTIFPIYFVCTQWLLISRKMDKTIWQFLFILVFSFFFVTTVLPPNTLTILSGGDDPLTHEAFSRAVLLSQNTKEFLMGGERSLYYYQPLYRYALASLHYLFGESLFWIFVVQTMLVCVLLRGTYILLNRLGKKVSLVFSLLFLPILAFSFTSLFGLAMSVLQQSIAVPVFLLVIIYLFIFWLQRENRIGLYCLLGLFFGFSLMTRTDLLPGMLGILLLLWYTVSTSHDRRREVLLAGSFVVCTLLPVLFVGFRNFYLFGVFSVLPQSGGVNLLQQFNNYFHISGPSSVGAGTLYVKIVLIYQHNLIKLAAILGKNIVENFIGYNPFRILVWYFVPFALFLSFIKKGVNFKYLLVVLLIVLPLIAANSFYGVHNGWSMLMHLDFLLILLSALTFGVSAKKTEVSSVLKQ